MKNSLNQLLAYILFDDVKDVKTFLLRVASAILGLIMVVVMTNQDRILGIWENNTKETIKNELVVERLANYRMAVKERTAMAYVQTNADIVGVFEYSPQYVNDFSSLVEYEGKRPLEKRDWQNIVINKSSPGYQKHLTGKPFSFTARDSVENVPSYEYRASTEALMIQYGLEYVYSCPIFDLHNQYAGYIAISWAKEPYKTETEKAYLEDSLETTCQQHARAIGRTK